MSAGRQKMKILYFISVVSACLALPGCATEQSANGIPGATLNPETIPVVPPASLNPGDKMPKLIYAVNAVYPAELRKEGVIGVVTVQYVVDTNGNVVSPTVIKSPDPRLSQAVLDAISQWKFAPGEKNGHKVNTRMENPISFDLDP
jgi:TonB family protein